MHHWRPAPKVVTFLLSRGSKFTNVAPIGWQALPFTHEARADGEEDENGSEAGGGHYSCAASPATQSAFIIYKVYSIGPCSKERAAFDSRAEACKEDQSQQGVQTESSQPQSIFEQSTASTE
jgi:hypothetical protein